MGSRFMNIAYVLVGCLGVISSVLPLLNHQYAFLHRNVFTEDPKRWMPTIAILLLGIWFFILGLVGLIDEMRRTKPNSK